MHSLSSEGLLFFLHWRHHGRSFFPAAHMLTQTFHPLCQLLQLCMHNHLVDGPRFAFAMHDAVDKLFSCYFPITVIEKVEQGRTLLQDKLRGCNCWKACQVNHSVHNTATGGFQTGLNASCTNSLFHWISSCMLQLQLHVAANIDIPEPRAG